MEYITRQEKYLAYLAQLKTGTLPAPQTREETYLAAIAGLYKKPLPYPQTRVETYLKAIADGKTTGLPEPKTRKEYYLYAIATDDTQRYIPTPITREEQLLDKIVNILVGVEDVTVSGNGSVMLYNAANHGFTGMTLYGKSTQVSTTGAQLFNMSEIMAETLLGTETPIEVHAVGYWTSGYIPVKTGNYICSSKDSARGWTYDADKNGLRYISNSGGSPIPIKEGEAFIRVTGANTADPQNFMFNEGNSIKPYEPYTGGNPSPTPQYPQEIKSVGDAGEISVEVCGKNLIAGRKFYGNYSNGIAYIIKLDGDVVFPYKPSYTTYGICYAINALAGKKYTFSGYNLNDNASLRIAEYANLNDALNSANVIGYKSGGHADTVVTYTAKKNGIIICLISGRYSPNNDMIHVCTESELLQIELGSTATSYEPYKPAQTIIIPTPNGLPGIPVSSGGNYTDEKGQQWVADEIDLANGEMVQRIGKIVVDGEKMKFVAGSNSIYWNLPLKTSPGVILDSKCTSRYFNKWIFLVNNLYDFIYTTSKIMKPYFDTVEELNAFCVQKNSEGNPLTIYYCIGTPIRTPLSPETIAAYKALRTYSPTTTVINDAGADMKVTYRCNLKKTESELEALYVDTEREFNAIAETEDEE